MEKPESVCNFMNYHKAFRALIFIFGTDNYIKIDDLVAHTANFIHSPYDDIYPDIKERLLASLQKVALLHSSTQKSLNETEFCKFMDEAFANTDANKGMNETLAKVFLSMCKGKKSSLPISCFRDLLLKTGIELSDKEYSDVVGMYFDKSKETITEEEYIQFASNKYTIKSKSKEEEKM